MFLRTWESLFHSFSLAPRKVLSSVQKSFTFVVESPLVSLKWISQLQPLLPTALSYSFYPEP